MSGAENALNSSFEESLSFLSFRGAIFSPPSSNGDDNETPFIDSLDLNSFRKELNKPRKKKRRLEEAFDEEPSFLATVPEGSFLDDQDPPRKPLGEILPQPSDSERKQNQTVEGRVRSILGRRQRPNAQA